MASNNASPCAMSTVNGTCNNRTGMPRCPSRSKNTRPLSSSRIKPPRSRLAILAFSSPVARTAKAEFDVRTRPSLPTVTAITPAEERARPTRPDTSSLACDTMLTAACSIKRHIRYSSPAPARTTRTENSVPPFRTPSTEVLPSRHPARPARISNSCEASSRPRSGGARNPSNSFPKRSLAQSSRPARSVMASAA